MRSGITVLLLVLASGCFAQQDSVLLKPLVVYGILDAKYLTGSALSSLDSTIKKQNTSQHLGEVMSLEFPIYFRNYGNGMISGISLRGTSPSHTAVLWNGININSFSLGQADFSILPAAAFEDVKLHAGGGGALFGSGAMGGTILLNSSAGEAPPLTLTQEVGSFGRYFTSARGAWKAKRFSFNTTFYHLVSENDFPVLSTGERQQHASFRQWGALQDIEYQWSSAKTLSIHYWYHNADRDIQPSIGQANSGDEQQQDENHRLSIQYKSNSRRGMFSATGGYIHDVIIYNGIRSVVSRWTSEARHQFPSFLKVSAQVGLTWNHIRGEIREYRNGLAEEDRFDFLVSFQRSFGTRLSLALNLRQPTVSGFKAPFLPYLGAEYSLLKQPGQSLVLRGNVSKNYRVPTLNDRYWGTVGRKDLLPETSVSAEAGVQWKTNSLTVESTFFTQQVDQWIQWWPLPGSSDFYPENVKKVSVRGLETKIRWQGKLGKVTVIPMATYQQARSITTEAPPAYGYLIGKQLIYTPRHTAAGNIQVIFQEYSAGFNLQYNSQRFTESSNTELFALPSFVVMNVSVGRYWNLRRHRIDVIASARNIAAKDYQLYASRAMPGRNYAIQLTYQFNKSQQK